METVQQNLGKSRFCSLSQKIPTLPFYADGYWRCGNAPIDYPIKGFANYFSANVQTPVYMTIQVLDRHSFSWQYESFYNLGAIIIWSS